MSFAILFIITCLIGFVTYHFSKQWLYAVGVPIALFLISILLDEQIQSWQFSLLFGVPLVFFAGLLGAYIYQTRVVVQEETDDEDKDS